MSFIYAMSDIHGFLRPLYKRFDQLGNLQPMMDEKDKLILLGDYIDGGTDSLQTIEMIFVWQESYPKNIIVLRGNHEDIFIDFLDGKENAWLGADAGLKTSKTFLNEEQLEKVKELAIEGSLRKVYPYVRECIKKNHKDLINWMRKLPYFFETKNQIFVHAGVDEEAEELWKVGTPDYYFVSKYPATTGKFYKDIIAGHIGTSSISGNLEFYDIYFDGQSHYYIDGTVEISGIIPVLAYDEVKKTYYSLQELTVEESRRCRDDRLKVCGKLRQIIR
jgi:serine/threonine protein phosphatase 1